VTLPGRLVPLLDQFDFACERLTNRIAGPTGNSGDGRSIDIIAMTDDEYLWEPVPHYWSIRRCAGGPGPGATVLVAPASGVATPLRRRTPGRRR
jgi:hypothetical protein